MNRRPRLDRSVQARLLRQMAFPSAILGFITFVLWEIRTISMMRLISCPQEQSAVFWGRQCLLVAILCRLPLSTHIMNMAFLELSNWQNIFVNEFQVTCKMRWIFWKCPISIIVTRKITLQQKENRPFFFHDTQGKNYGFSEGKLEPLLGYLGQWLKKAIKAAQCRVYVAGYNWQRTSSSILKRHILAMWYSGGN